MARFQFGKAGWLFLRRCNLSKPAFNFAITVLFVAFASFAAAQPIQTIYSFTNYVFPSGLTLGNDGNFYGTTIFGGLTNSQFRSGMGTVFQVTTNGTFTTLASFNFTNGATPNGLTLGSDGNFYGTAQYGGITNSENFEQGFGTVFQVTTNGAMTALASFNFADGATPNGLTLGNDGNFYGTTYDGIRGTAFLVTSNGTLTTLALFGPPNAYDPNGLLRLGNDGDFYGTTAGSSTDSVFADGSVFRLTTNGTLTTLAAFQGPNSVNGAYPTGVTLGEDGNFYGTTSTGGISESPYYPQGMGTVFQVTTNGTLTMLASCNFTNGASPTSPLTQLGTDGNFYGTTSAGGITQASEFPQGMGTVFQLMTNGTLTAVACFNFTNGAYPYYGLTLGNDGNFYGTTANGGVNGMGTIFRFLPPLVSVQPQNQTIHAGATATFQCATTILQPLGFQWQKNGTNLANGGNILGASSNSLTISGISDSDAGSYSVVVSSAETRGVSSPNASLTVDDSLFIAAQPLSQTVGAGSRVTFAATVFGGQPFIIQWLFNQMPIGLPVADNDFSFCILTNVGTNQAGNYTVEAINDSGSLTSSNAVLTVIPQPTLDLRILAGFPVLNLSGTPGNDFLVQYTTNLADTNWVNLLSLTNLPTSPYLFLDPAGVGEPARFYRSFFTQ